VDATGSNFLSCLKFKRWIFFGSDSKIVCFKLYLHLLLDVKLLVHEDIIPQRP
jgi:hypothetical protein